MWKEFYRVPTVVENLEISDNRYVRFGKGTEMNKIFEILK